MPKEPEMFVDKGEADGLFEHYQAAPEAIESSAEELDGHASKIQAFSKEVDAQHQAAVSRVSGVISDPMSTATRTPTAYSTLMMGRTYVSSGSTRLFGQGVQRFNRTIDKLNEQYRQAQASDFGVADATYPDQATLAQRNEIDSARGDQIMDARVALLGTLVDQYRTALDKLDEDAESSAARVKAGATDEVLQDLYASGALPSSVETAFPDIAFVAKTLPADADEMSDVELAEYLREHPNLLGNAQAMAEVAERIEGLTMEDGEASGRVLRDALSGRASMSDVEGELALLSLVGMYGSYAQSRGQALPKGASQYVRGLFTDLVHGGAEDRTMDVLDWITAREHVVERLVPDPSTDSSTVERITVPGFDQATQDWMKQAYADGILLMSDGDTNGLGRDYISPDVETALNDVPRTETDSQYDGHTETTAITITGGDGYAKLADLLGHSSEGIQPGRALADELTESTADVARVISDGFNAGRDASGTEAYLGYEDALSRFSPLMEQAVDVSARNVDANEALLTEAGSNGDSPAAEQLRTLYTFPWVDEGRSVSQYTDWIADYSRYPDGSPEELQAKEASAGFINFVTDADADGTTNNFKALMQGGTPDDMAYDGRPLSFGDVNPELAKGFGLVTASNLDALDGRESKLDTTTETLDGSLTVADADRHRLFTLVGTSEGAAKALGYTIGGYEQDQLDQALATGDPVTLKATAAEAARLDGYFAGGVFNARMIESDGAYQNQTAASNEAMMYVTTGKAIVTGGLSYVPGGGGISAATGLFFDGLGRTIDVPEVPPGIDVSGPASDGYVKSLALWDYATALERSEDAAMPDGLQEEMDRIRAHLHKKYGADVELTGALLGTPELEAIEGVLEHDPLYMAYMNEHPGSAPFDETAINDEGTHDEAAVRDFLEGGKS
jgi:hypothetical protein